MRTFIVTGLTGAGKSSFVNCAFGVELAPVHQFEACTKVVKHYPQGTAWGKICIIDTPGLREDSEELDRRYLKSIKSVMRSEEVEAVIYITKITDTRLSRDERRAIALLSEELGKQVWQSTWLVFTFCAAVHPNQLQQTYEARFGHISTALRANGVDYRFDKALLCDNHVPNWTLGCQPLVKMLIS
jgi:GTPase Era involved in 16S rRNA processing